MNADDYSSLILAKATIREILNKWNANTSAGHSLQPYNYSYAASPVEIIRRILATCPDEAPAPGTSVLGFISDIDLRANLRNDIGAVNRALSSGEWKAATVLAGSAAEALLLWVLKQQQPSSHECRRDASSNESIAITTEFRPGQIECCQYIEVAANLQLIKENTAKQARLAKDFRNFVHPGVAQRLNEKCDRATALSAVAGMELVVRDLSP